MRGGFVLGFSDNTFNDFFLDTIGLDITDEKYKQSGNSKANRLRAFWQQESDQVIGKVTKEMLTLVPEHWTYRKDVLTEEVPASEQQALDESLQLVERLLGGPEVEHLENLQAVTWDPNLSLLAKHVKSSIESGEPEAGLDRLHTFSVKYFRSLGEKHGLTFTQDEALNAIYGKYLKTIRAAGLIKSEMSECILTYSITILSKFNYVRNNQSLAHDNDILNRAESILIFRNVYALLKFAESIEELGPQSQGA